LLDVGHLKDHMAVDKLKVSSAAIISHLWKQSKQHKWKSVNFIVEENESLFNKNPFPSCSSVELHHFVCLSSQKSQKKPFLVPSPPNLNLLNACFCLRHHDLRHSRPVIRDTLTALNLQNCAQLCMGREGTSTAGRARDESQTSKKALCSSFSFNTNMKTDNCILSPLAGRGLAQAKLGNEVWKIVYYQLDKLRKFLDWKRVNAAKLYGNHLI